MNGYLKVSGLTAVYYLALCMTGYPAARRCHSCVQVKDGKAHFYCAHNMWHASDMFSWVSPHVPLFLPPEVFICGGYNGELILSDLWKINLQNYQWNKLPAVMPEPAYFHCAAVTPVSATSCAHPHTAVSGFQFCIKLVVQGAVVYCCFSCMFSLVAHRYWFFFPFFFLSPAASAEMFRQSVDKLTDR